MSREGVGHLDVLVADGDPSQIEIISEAVRHHGTIEVVTNGRDALVKLDTHDYDLAILDVQLAIHGGFELLLHLQKSGATTDVVLTNAAGSIPEAVAVVKAGAVDYVAKPVDPARLMEVVGEVAQRRMVLGRRPLSGESEGGLIGQSRAMAVVRDRMLAFAESEAPVLILGASGTGKELAARFIHERSPRASGPFVAINCAAFPEGLIEAELFGHVRGAFTGAIRDRKGKIASATEGTLFLDEVGELPLAAQAKLLRVLEERRFCPVGSNTAAEANVRVVSATNQDLKRAVAEGRFREDLYFRLRVLDITMPSLAQRQGDLLLLVEHFLRANARDGHVSRLSPRAWAALQAHPFPGNVRELKHLIQRAVTLARGADIRLEHLPDELLAGAEPFVEEESGPVAALGTAVEQFERELIRHALHESNGNRANAARSLGISRKNLWQKMRAYRIAA